MRRCSCARITLSLAARRLPIVLRRTVKRPDRRLVPQIWVKPRKLKVSGFPSPRCFRRSAAKGKRCQVPFPPINMTTYTYNDPLNRLTGKTYSDSTPPATFSYDQTSVTIGSWSSGTLSNPKGRLTEAVTTSGGNVQTAVVYSYDPMGRPANFFQCTPANCGGSSTWSMPISYDLAGDITAWTHPNGITFTNTISPAQRTTQISSDFAYTNFPAIIADR